MKNLKQYKRLGIATLLLVLLDECTFKNREKSLSQIIEEESLKIDEKFVFNPPSFARSGAYFSLKNGELISWDVPGNRYCHILGLEGDEKALMKLMLSTNIHSLDRLLQNFTNHSYALPLAIALLTPPPGIGTAIGVGVSLAFTFWNSKKKNYIKENTELMQETLLGLRIPCEIILQANREGLIIDMNEKSLEEIQRFLNYLDIENSNISSWIQSNPSSRLSFDNFIGWHESFNNMLRSIIDSKGYVKSIEEQKLEALKTALDEGVIVEKFPNGAIELPMMKQYAKVLADRFYLIEVAPVVGCIKAESEEGMYTITIPGTDSDINYRIDSLRTQPDHLGRKQVVYITAASELTYKTSPVRKAYYSSSQQELVEKGILGKTEISTTFWGGLSTISSKTQILSGLGLDMRATIDQNESKVITIGPSTNLGFVVSGTDKYNLPVLLQSEEPFIITRVQEKGEYVGLTEEQRKIRDYIESIGPSDWRYLFVAVFLKRGLPYEEVYKIITGLKELRMPGSSSAYYNYSYLSSSVPFEISLNYETYVSKYTHGGRGSREYYRRGCRTSAEHIDLGNYFAYSSNQQFVDRIFGVSDYWLELGETSDNFRKQREQYPNSYILKFRVSESPTRNSFIIGGLSYGHYWTCTATM